MPSAVKRRRRPGLSVTSIEPSGRNANDHGCSSPDTTSVTWTSAFVGSGDSGASAVAARTLPGDAAMMAGTDSASTPDRIPDEKEKSRIIMGRLLNEFATPAHAGTV